MPLHALLGLEIRPFDEADPDLAVVDMPVTPNAFGTTGNLHGGAIATLLDVACTAAASRASTYSPMREHASSPRTCTCGTWADPRAPRCGPKRG